MKYARRLEKEFLLNKDPAFAKQLVEVVEDLEKQGKKYCETGNRDK